MVTGFTVYAISVGFLVRFCCRLVLLLRSVALYFIFQFIHLEDCLCYVVAFLFVLVLV